MKDSRPLLLCAIILLLPALCFAQDATGRITGTVSDPQGLVIPEVRITVTNTATQVTRTTKTDAAGTYQVLALPIGNYKLTAEHEGFRTVLSDQYKLLINQSLRVDFHMEIGAATQTVDVGAEAVEVETVNPTLGQSVTGRSLTNMPLNGRDTLDLALLQPGVTESNDDNAGAGKYSIAGGRSDSVTFLLDGGLNNDLLDNSNLLDPNPDSIAEFRLLTSNYTAEYGRNGGGIISVVTKSGTNKIHGSGFEFLRNRALDANDYFNKDISPQLPRLDLKRNQFGGTLGGPIFKDKFFFFAAYQGTRQVQAVPDNSIPVFTTEELQGDFSHVIPFDGVSCTIQAGCPDPGVASFLQANPFFQPDPTMAANAIIAPISINTISQNYISHNFIPSTPSGIFSASLSEYNNADELTTKFDYELTQKDKISATIGLNRTPFSNPFPFATVPGFPAVTTADYAFVNIAYTRVFSPTLLNEFHFVTHRSNYLQDKTVVKQPTGPDLGIEISPDIATGPTNLFFDTGLDIGPSENGPTRYIENTFSWTDAVSWTKGKHNWKFGAGFSPYQENLSYAYYTNGEFDFYSQTSVATGNAYADFLLGIPDAYFQGANAPSNIRSKSTYVFGQDEWHLRKDLVLTLGLRYEYNTPKSDTQGRLFTVIPGEQSKRFTNAPLGMVFPGDPGVPWGTNFPDKKNFAPRFGFAWDPRGDGKTSIRGGIGIFYDILKGEDNLQYNGQPPFVSNAGLFFSDFSGTGASPAMQDPFGTAGVPNTFPSRPPPSNIDFGPFLPINSTGFVFLVAPHIRTPYIYQYNLSVQRNLFSDIVMEVNYEGTSSHGLTSVKDVNPLVLGTDNRKLDSSCFKCFVSLPEFQNVSNANYNALAASLTRQAKNTRLGTAYFTLSYTYSHNLDNASGFQQRNFGVPANDPGLFYASADNDVRNRISFSGGWDLPLERAWTSGPKRLTKGWSVYPIVT
jgi:hypothetical protein